MQSLELDKLKRLLMAARSLFFDQCIAAIIYNKNKYEIYVVVFETD